MPSVKPWKTLSNSWWTLVESMIAAENSGRSVSGVSYGDVVADPSVLLLLHRSYLSNHVVTKS